jgi:putative membrane protein
MVERGMEFGWVFIVIFSILIILGMIKFVNMISASGGRKLHGESPLHILQKRYAKGEITSADFEKMKDELTKDFCRK